MKKYIQFLALMMFVVAACSSVETISLINGENLEGWHVDVPAMDSNPDTINPFLIRDGMLVSLGRPAGHLITDSVFSDYRLVAEYRFVEEPGNCGILVHASTPRALYDMFPQSIEVQLQHTNAGDFWCIKEDIKVDNMVELRGPEEEWGISEGTNRRIVNMTDGSEFDPGEWNTMVIECIDDEIFVWVNTDLVNHGYDCTATRGHIAIQSEGSEVEFRRLDLIKLD
ncbi:MAG: DUF1080 domain-containing protein [Bacteroidota bacterium]|nr:DUF1080 domain-containing protein [Bacteroidota bacterium]